jgi:hypothetical protein
MTAAPTTPSSLPRRLLLRLLHILVMAAVAVGIRWLLTDHISLPGLQLLLSGLGAAVFGTCGLVAEDLGRRVPNVFARLGVLASIVGAVLFAVGVWTLLPLPGLWRTVGACFFIAFAGVRGSLVSIVGRTTVVRKQLALLVITISMTLGVLLCSGRLPSWGFTLFGIAALIETGAVMSILIRRAEAPTARSSATDDEGASAP